MCGDLEEDGGDAAAFEQFRGHAERLAASARARRANASGIERYLDDLFVEILGRLSDEREIAGVHSSQRLALAPVVLARLAGLLAGHAPLAEDPLRRTIEALMLGYGEPGAFFETERDEHRARHDHRHHDHDHGHGHGHGGHHHHHGH